MPVYEFFEKGLFAVNEIDWCVFNLFSEQKVLQLHFFEGIDL
jgi:hypothetical protein